jgi:hypothetical protein
MRARLDRIPADAAARSPITVETDLERVSYKAAVGSTYSITASARSRIAGGMVNPMDFAALRLMTNSNLVAW